MIKPILALTLLASPLCLGQATTLFRDIKRHVQVGPEDFIFLGGSLSLSVTDGNFVIGPCLDDPSPSIVPPYIFCPPGTQGLVAFGDINADGIRDAGQFWAVTSVVAASQVEPFRADRVAIISAPPGGLANIIRGAGGEIENIFEVQDTSTIIWWDVLSFPIQQYDITGYAGERPYDSGDMELARQYFDLRWGGYAFSYPFLDDPQNPFDDLLQLEFGVTHNVTPDIFPSRGLIEEGWRLNGTDDAWVDLVPPYPTLALERIFSRESTPVEITSALEVDGRSFYQFVWEGINFSNTLASDSLFFSMLGVYQVLAEDPLTGGCIEFTDPITGLPLDPVFDFGIIFPPYLGCTPESDRDEILIGTFDGQLDLPPFFFGPGDFVYAHLRWVRGLNAGSGTTDASQRSLLIPIAFVDTWEGFRTFSAPFPSLGGYPFGTPFSERLTTNDLDGDGWDDLTEFALYSDLNDFADTDDGDTGILPARPDFETSLTAANSWTTTAFKRPYLSSKVALDFEYSLDGGTTWLPITDTDPDWAVTSLLADANGDPVTIIVEDPLIGPVRRINVVFDTDGETVLSSELPVEPLRERIVLTYLPMIDVMVRVSARLES